PGLVGLVPGVRLEKEDPLHRGGELHFSEDGKGLVGCQWNSNMNLLFSQWAGLVSDSGIPVSEEFNPNGAPFFMWLEGTKACLGEKNEVLATLVDHLKVGDITSVQYGRNDGIRLVYPWGGVLYAKEFDKLLAPGPGEALTTTVFAPNDTKEPGALAY